MATYIFIRTNAGWDRAYVVTHTKALGNYYVHSYHNAACGLLHNSYRMSLLAGLLITGLGWTGLDWNPKICFYAQKHAIKSNHFQGW